MKQMMVCENDERAKLKPIANSAAPSLSWVTTKLGKIPEGAIVAGYEANGEETYVSSIFISSIIYVHSKYNL